MAKYTVELRKLMENPEARAALDKALSEYPLYQSEKAYDMIPTREQLNTRLLNHYKYREIGFDTVGRFLDELKITMGEIMPYYNALLDTVVIMAELPSPFDNVDVIETFEQEREDVSKNDGSNTQQRTSSDKQTSTTSTDTTGSNTQSAHGKKVESDTPQNTLEIPAAGIDSLDYASKAEWSNDETEGSNTEKVEGTATTDTEGTTEETGSHTTTTESTGTLKTTFKKTGNQGVNTYAHDMNEFRTSIIDVVDQIVNDHRIAQLFMMIF